MESFNFLYASLLFLYFELGFGLGENYEHNITMKES